jgi:hypothetical protein
MTKRKRIGANRKRVKERNRYTRKKGAVKAVSVMLVVVALVSLCGVLIYAAIHSAGRISAMMERSNLLKVNNLCIKGNTTVSTDEIMNCLKPLIPEKVYRIDKKKLLKAGRGFAPVEKLRIGWNWAGKVTVTVLERKPVALVNFGRISCVDRHGVVYPLQKAMTEPLPLVSGLKDSVGAGGLKMIAGKDMHCLLSILKGAGEVGRNFERRISQIDMNRHDGVRIKFEDSPTVFLIDGEERLRHVDRMRELFREEDPPPFINMCFRNLAFVAHDQAVRETKIDAVTD